MTAPTLEEVWPKDVAPVCAGCGNEVDPRFATMTPDYKLVCALCAERRSSENGDGDTGG